MQDNNPTVPHPAADSRPLDPTGISDLVHERRKQGLPTGLNEALLDYEADHRVC